MESQKRLGLDELQSEKALPNSVVTEIDNYHKILSIWRVLEQYSLPWKERKVEAQPKTSSGAEDSQASHVCTVPIDDPFEAISGSKTGFARAPELDCDMVGLLLQRMRLTLITERLETQIPTPIQSPLLQDLRLFLAGAKETSQNVAEPQDRTCTSLTLVFGLQMMLESYRVQLLTADRNTTASYKFRTDALALANNVYLFIE